ncbi:Carboxylesterase NlhH [Colletotrichum siamense]|uniref:Carboxylesterase NlhH n=1 Tax=Colletotrichum siamense TaxID=690259 RepID=UPI0018728257|nr:Carboxylesterase NlhH [Colletotrichum siamense]KAF5500457.1 Carboxylesterase NlhH [Colletotrichum siamense]
MTTTAVKNALRFDPEYLAVVSARDAGGEGPAPFKDVHELRAWSEPTLRSVLKAQPWPENVLETRIPFKSHDGQDIDLVRFATQEMADAPEPQGAVVYVHGGGFVTCDVDIFAPQVKRFVEMIGLPFFAVDYRLAPEFPDGLGAEDVYFGLRHLSDHAGEWNVDPANIVIMGDSAGAGIAAGVALIARDRGLSPGLRKQILVYPMLDDRTNVPETAGHYKFLAWNTNDNRLAWGAVLGAKAGDPAAKVSLYAAPGRAGVEDLRGLPPTYIDVGGLDLFRDECIEYAAKLSKADVEVEFHMWPGLPHGFESAPGIRWVERALEARNEAIKRL